ncbi:MAG: prepilin-type N-terminal cleavage/methylation domain-containing protein [Limnochordia bacterium]|jgi:type IV pilus assembly protein PilA
MLKALWRKLRQEEQGFTLVELVVVVVILGILAGVGIQQFGNVQERARQSAHDANVKVLTSAAQMYALIEGVQSDTTITKGSEDLLVPDYLAEWPNSPWDGGPEYTVEIKVDGNKKVTIEVSGGKPDSQK